MDTKSQEPLKLTSMAPLDDGGRKYNIIYVIAVVIGVIFGICAHSGILGILVANILTLPIALLIKHCILDWKWKRLRQQKFLLENRVPYDILIHYLIERLTSMNFQVEKGVEGNPIITHNKMIYDVIYGEDNSFIIWWRKSVMGAMFDFRISIYHYRNTVVDMGIIGYTVQQICCINGAGDVQQSTMYGMDGSYVSTVQANSERNGQNINQGPYETQKPLNTQSKKKHIAVIIIIFIFLILGGLYWIGSSTDEELVEEEAYFTEDAKDDNKDDTKNDTKEDNSYGLNEAVIFELNNGGQISITFTGYGSKSDVSYINYVIENVGNTSVTFGESMFSVYANDYIADLNFGENTIYEETISVGRKASGTLYPDMLLDKVRRLEIECGDVIFLLRDTSNVDAMLGTYYRQYEEDGNIIIDEIKLYRDEYNNNGLAISANHHKDFGNEFDLDYNAGSWVFELYDDRIEFTSRLYSIGGLVVYYSQNPKEEGIFVAQIDTQSVEDMFTGNYEWTDNIQAVYESVENTRQLEEDILLDEEYYDSEVQGLSSRILDNQCIGAVSASSELTDSVQTYKVDALFDGNKDTCWAEDVDGNGEGEYIEIEFLNPVYLTEIYFLNGYMKNEDVYNKNGKIKRVEVSISDGTSFDVDFQECSYHKAEEQTYSDCLLLEKPISTDYLKITICEAEAGEKYDDICLSEIELWGYLESDYE
ncbi:MAG: discoidin domain-containing protein [Lachnospiraceae bacterium]|nr:discoidin domain-containing protein [Lachnospiraceae bacterium]